MTDKLTPWSYRAGYRPHTVTAYERSDKGGTVWLRWTPLGGGTGKSAPVKMSLQIRVRGAADGRLSKEAVAEAKLAAHRAYAELLAGHDPRSRARSAPRVETPSPELGPVGLSISEGLDKALAITDDEMGGMYAVESEHTRDMGRYAREIIAALPEGLTHWHQLTAFTYQQVWRRLANRRAKVAAKTGTIRGRVATERAIVLLSQVGQWLAVRRDLPSTPPLPPRKWRELLADDWTNITRQQPASPAQPRHTPEEMGRLLLTVGKRLGDPRVCLACVLAGEARLGQALRCDRDSLDLKPGVGASGMGRFTIPDRGRKKGVVVDLTQALRAAVDFELNEGYLADLEAEFRAGRRANYPLFPGGKLVRGRARSTAGTHLGRSGANAQFHQLEVLAGIEPEKGRAWYGVRRQATDLGEDVEQDGRVLNKITGHQSDETRRRVYQAKRREKLLAKAAVARTALRALAVEAAEAASAPSPPIASSHWQLSQARKQARRRAAHVREVARRDTARGIVVTVEPTPKPTPGRGTRGKVEEKEQGSSA